MSISRSVASPAARSIARPIAGGGGGGGEPGPGPTLLEAPAITGSLAEDSELVFDIGLWADADSFEIEIVQTDPNETLLARQSVDGDTSGSVDTDVGGTITLRVWATNADGTTYATSDPFGPIEAAGDVWVGGFVLSNNGSHNPTPSGSPVTWTLLATAPTSNLYADPPGHGWAGSSVSATDFNGLTKTDPRLAGRWSANLGTSVTHFRLKLPDGPGTYILHAGLGGASTGTPRLALYNGTDSAIDTGSLIYQVNEDNAISVTSSQTMDAAGNVRTSENWTAESVYGGSPVEIEVAGDYLYVARPISMGATNLNCFAILKKAAV